MVVFHSFFFILETKKWSSYTVTTVREFTWVDLAFAVLDEWSSYRDGRLNRFDIVFKLRKQAPTFAFIFDFKI